MQFYDAQSDLYISLMSDLPVCRYNSKCVLKLCVLVHDRHNEGHLCLECSLISQVLGIQKDVLH